MLTESDLEECMCDQRVMAQFALFGIAPSDSKILFGLLDEEKQGILTIESFTAGCMNLRGNAQRLDLYYMFHELRQSLTNLERHVSDAANLQICNL